MSRTKAYSGLHSVYVAIEYIFPEISRMNLRYLGMQNYCKLIAGSEAPRKTTNTLKALSKVTRTMIPDTVANLGFWQPWFAAFEYGVLGNSLSETMFLRGANISVAIGLGWVYTKTLDISRYYLNREYYNDILNNIDRPRSLPQHIKNGMLDAIPATIFWDVVMAIILRFGQQCSWAHIGISTLIYSGILVIGSPLFGPVLKKTRQIYFFLLEQCKARFF